MEPVSGSNGEVETKLNCAVVVLRWPQSRRFLSHQQFFPHETGGLCVFDLAGALVEILLHSMKLTVSSVSMPKYRIFSNL